MKTYEIVRFFEREDVDNEVIARGQTLEQAQEHCNDPESSYATSTSSHGVHRTADFGAWFDGYRREET